MGVGIDLQYAIHLRLSATMLGVGKVATGVHDKRPQGDPPGGFPYVTHGENFVRERDSVTRKGFDALVRINLWSRASDTLEVLQMQDDAYAALHDADLAMPPFGGGADRHRCVSILRETTSILRDPDGTFHGVDEYRVLIETV